MRSPEISQKVIPVNATAVIWLAVLSQIDLALRHPQNNGAAARVAERFGDQLRDKLLEEGMLSKEEYAQSLREQILFRKNPIVGPPKGGME